MDGGQGADGIALTHDGKIDKVQIQREKYNGGRWIKHCVFTLTESSSVNMFSQLDQ